MPAPRKRTPTAKKKKTKTVSKSPPPSKAAMQSTYNKLIKKGMSPKQAAAFAKHTKRGKK